MYQWNCFNKHHWSKSKWVFFFLETQFNYCWPVNNSWIVFLEKKHDPLYNRQALYISGNCSCVFTLPILNCTCRNRDVWAFNYISQQYFLLGIIFLSRNTIQLLLTHCTIARRFTFPNCSWVFIHCPFLIVGTVTFGHAIFVSQKYFLIIYSLRLKTHFNCCLNTDLKGYWEIFDENGIQNSHLWWIEHTTRNIVM